MEVPYWSRTDGDVRDLVDEAAGSGPSRSTRDGEPVTLRPTQLVFATGMSGKPNVPDFPGMDVFRGDAAPLLARTRAPTRTPGKKAVVDRLATTPPSTSAARCGSTTPT